VRLALGSALQSALESDDMVLELGLALGLAEQ